MIPIPPELAVAAEPFDLDTLDKTIDLDRQFGHEVTPDEDSRVAPIRSWAITDDGAAEWALRHLAAIEHERAAIQEQADLWFDQIHQWLNGELARVRPRAEFFEGHLKRYGLAVRADDPRRATVSLPSGKISTRVPSGPVVDVTDEERVIEWAAGSLTDEEYEAVVRTTRKVLVSEIRKRVKIHADEYDESTFDGTRVGEPWIEYSVAWAATGEVVPGLAARQAETTATVTPAP